MDSLSSLESSSSSSSSSSSLLSPFRSVLEFMYENFTYILGTLLVIFGVLIYITMAGIKFDAPMMTTKRLVIETMEHKKGGKNDSNDDSNDGNNNDDNGNAANDGNVAAAPAPASENTMITPPIDLEKKLKSGFCNMHATKGSTAIDIDKECKIFGKSSCLNTDCCGWVITADNPEGICRSGSKNGMTFGYDESGKKIDVDCYYYKDAKSGPRCSS